MSYRNQQFYAPSRNDEWWRGDGNTGPGVPGDAVSLKSDNPKFTYPDNTIRTDGPNGPQTKKLERGYIRSLLTEAQGEAVPLKKCQFQFNPAQLAQSVSMNASMYNFFLQDPAQMAQPIGSEVTFGFDVFFDRSMELNNPKLGDTEFNNPWATGDPSEVGVLRDIASFYSVIGQGISADQKDFAAAQFEKTLNTESNQSDGAISAEDLATAKGRLTDYFNNVDVNLGNTAFLMPLPIRVMFSSLYMVDGYVTNTTVVYTKFNSAMVPMQATMSVSIRALYIGFAKRDTFVTENIRKAVEIERADIKAAGEAKRDAYEALSMEMNVLNYRVIGTENKVAFTPHGVLFPGQKCSLQARVPIARESGAMTSMFAASPDLSVKYNLKFEMWGPFNTLADIDAVTGKYKDPQFSGRSPLIRLIVSSDSISSADDWKSKVVDKEVEGSEAPNKAALGAIVDPLDPAKYYSWVVTGGVNASIEGAALTGKIVTKVIKLSGSSSSGSGAGVGTFNDNAFAYFDLDENLGVVWEAIADDVPGSLPAVSDSTGGYATSSQPATNTVSTVDQPPAPNRTNGLNGPI